MIERIQYIHNHLPGIGKSIIYCSFTENNLKSCFHVLCSSYRVGLEQRITSWMELHV